MTGLVFAVVGIGQEHRRQLVKADLAIGLGIFNLWALRRRLELTVIGRFIMNCERKFAESNILFDKRHGTA